MGRPAAHRCHPNPCRPNPCLPKPCRPNPRHPSPCRPNHCHPTRVVESDLPRARNGGIRALPGWRSPPRSPAIVRMFFASEGRSDGHPGMRGCPGSAFGPGRGRRALEGGRLDAPPARRHGRQRSREQGAASVWAAVSRFLYNALRVWNQIDPETVPKQVKVHERDEFRCCVPGCAGAQT